MNDDDTRRLRLERIAELTSRGTGAAWADFQSAAAEHQEFMAGRSTWDDYAKSMSVSAPVAPYPDYTLYQTCVEAA